MVRKYKLTWNSLIFLGIMALFASDFHLHATKTVSTNSSTSITLTQNHTTSYQRQVQFSFLQKGQVIQNKEKFVQNSEGFYPIITTSSHSIRAPPEYIFS